MYALSNSSRMKFPLGTLNAAPAGSQQPTLQTMAPPPHHRPQTVPPNSMAPRGTSTPLPPTPTTPVAPSAATPKSPVTNHRVMHSTVAPAQPTPQLPSSFEGNHGGDRFVASVPDLFSSHSFALESVIDFTNSISILTEIQVEIQSLPLLVFPH